MAARNFWTVEETLAMLEIFREKELCKIFDGKQRNAEVYAMACEEMRKRGYVMKNSVQIRTKWKSLKSAYNRCKRAKLENEVVEDCEFYDILDELITDALTSPKKDFANLVTNRSSEKKRPTTRKRPYVIAENVRQPEVPRGDMKICVKMGSGIDVTYFSNKKEVKFDLRDRVVKKVTLIFNDEIVTMEDEDGYYQMSARKTKQLKKEISSFQTSSAVEETETPEDFEEPRSVVDPLLTDEDSESISAEQNLLLEKLSNIRKREQRRRADQKRREMIRSDAVLHEQFKQKERERYYRRKEKLQSTGDMVKDITILDGSVRSEQAQEEPEIELTEEEYVCLS